MFTVQILTDCTVYQEITTTWILLSLGCNLTLWWLFLCFYDLFSGSHVTSDIYKTSALETCSIFASVQRQFVASCSSNQNSHRLIDLHYINLALPFSDKSIYDGGPR